MKKSCTHSCGPSDYYPGGKCDLMGCLNKNSLPEYIGNNFMSQIFNVSLNFAELMAKAKASHSAFTRSKAGVPYVSVAVFVNDSPDQYGNDVKVTLNSSKAKKSVEGTTYIGNGSTNSGSGKASHKKTDDGQPDDDLPF